jgi:hypothetical protein
MPAGDVSGGKDHHHEHGADGERRDHAGRAVDDRAANREDEKESSDEFAEVFVHNFSAC